MQIHALLLRRIQIRRGYESVNKPSVHVSDRSKPCLQGIIAGHDRSSDTAHHSVLGVRMIRQKKLHTGGSKNQHQLPRTIDAAAGHPGMGINDTCADRNSGFQSEPPCPLICKPSDASARRTDLTSQLTGYQIAQARIQLIQNRLGNIPILRRPHGLVGCHIP